MGARMPATTIIVITCVLVAFAMIGIIVLWRASKLAKRGETMHSRLPPQPAGHAEGVAICPGCGLVAIVLLVVTLL